MKPTSDIGHPIQISARALVLLTVSLALVISSVALTVEPIQAVEPFADPAPIPSYVGDLAGAALAGLTPVDVASDGGFFYVIDVARYRVVKVDRVSGGVAAVYGGVRSTAPPGIAAARAVAVDSVGDVYVADTPNAVVQKLDGDLMFDRAWGGKGSGETEFDQVYGVAVGVGKDKAGVLRELLYTVDGDGRLKKWHLDGTFIGDFSSGIVLDQPRQVEVHPVTNDVWLINARDRQIVVIDVDGAERFRFGSDGSGPGQFSGDPRGITISADGSRVFVADDGNHRVQVFDDAGNFVESLGGAVGDADYLVDVRGLDATADGRLVVTDEWDFGLKEFTSGGVFVRSLFGAAAPLGGVNSPRGLAVDSLGRVYVSDWWNQRVDRWDGDGSDPFMWGFRGTRDEPGSVNFAWDVAVQPGGADRVFLANRESHEIEVFESDGGFVTRWGDRGAGDGEFEFPQGVAFAPDGSLVVTDSGNGRVQRFSVDAGGVGTFVESFGSVGTLLPGALNVPAGVSVGGDGTVWVADTRNNRVQSYDPVVGSWSVFAGASGLSDFKLPWGVTVAPDGAVWVADSGEDRVVKMSVDGTAVFAATGPEMGAGDLDSPHAIAFGADGAIYVSDIWNNRIIIITEQLAPSNVEPPTVSGVAEVGGTLSAVAGSWTGEPTGFAYQWQRCDTGGCSDVTGETSVAYVASWGDVGFSLRVVETAMNIAGSAAEFSLETDVVPEPLAAPTNVSLPSVSGGAEVGGTLTAGTGSWIGTAPISYDFQWQRCDGACSDIVGETSGTYVVSDADVGLSLRAVVAATNSIGAASAFSVPTGVVPDPVVPPVLPTFIDIAGNIHESSIELIAAAGITKGCNPPMNNRYCPSDSVTRGQMAAFLNRSLDLPATPIDFFTDDDDSVFEGDINRLAAAGITKGCNPPANDQYCADGVVTRGQMAAFLNRALDLPGTPEDFFTDDDDSVFEGDINRLAAAGITKGCNPPTNDRFCPTRVIPRDEMATFLARGLGL